METTRHLVALVVELAASVEDRHHYLGRCLAAGVLVDRNTSSVVDNRYRVVNVDGDTDGVAVSPQRFIDGVVDDLIDQVMEPRCTGRPDVHCRARADRLEALQNLDLVGAVVFTVGDAGGWDIALEPGIALRLFLIKLRHRWSESLLTRVTRSPLTHASA